MTEENPADRLRALARAVTEGADLTEQSDRDHFTGLRTGLLMAAEVIEQWFREVEKHNLELAMKLNSTRSTIVTPYIPPPTPPIRAPFPGIPYSINSGGNP